MTVRYLLDVDMCFRLAHGDQPHVRRKLEATRPGDLGLSVITFGELCFGSTRASVHPNAVPISALLAIVPVVALEPGVADAYARVRSRVRPDKPLGMNRMWLVAHALHLDAAIVTASPDISRCIPDFRTENWMAHAPLDLRRRAS